MAISVRHAMAFREEALQRSYYVRAEFLRYEYARNLRNVRFRLQSALEDLRQQLEKSLQRQVDLQNLHKGLYSEVLLARQARQAMRDLLKGRDSSAFQLDARLAESKGSGDALS